MGSSKIKKSLIACSLLFSINSFSSESFTSEFEKFKQEQTSSSEFEQFKQQQQDTFFKYKKTIQEEFIAYKKAYDEAFSEFKKDISAKWPETEFTTKHKWVEYDPNYDSKKVVDFEKEEIKLEVFEDSEKAAKEKMEKMLDDLFKKDVASAHKNDILEKKIAKKLKKPLPKVESKKKIIADVVKEDEQKKIIQNLIKANIKPIKPKTKQKKKFIYKLNVKLPSNTTVKKAKQFKSDVLSNAKKQDIPAELIYAIMHSESSFNPMARSHIPAFGLMQIVPKTAGVDSYKYLYGKKRLLSSNYLYNSSKNINIGSGYLHILYFRYLKKIKDPRSRMYCSIAAYNTGAGNVAKAFIGSYNINRASAKINKMTPEQVYKHLMKNLPYNETKKYLKKVTDRVSAYNKLLKTTL